MSFRRCCTATRIAYAPQAVEYLYDQYCRRRGITPRGCHPRDIMDHLLDTARFLEVDPVLSRDLLDRACRSYFLDMAGQDD